MSSSIKLRCLDNDDNVVFLVDSVTGVVSYNTIPSTNASSGSFVVFGGVSIKSTTDCVSVTQGGALSIAGGVSIEKSCLIGGGLSCTSDINTIGSLITNEGNIGIGKTNPDYALDVVGDIFATGNISGFSDARLKTDVNTITDALQIVEKMRGVFYTHIKTNERGVGVIAQETRAVLPEAVVEKGEYLGVAYGNIVGVLIEAIKELSAKVERLERQLDI